jgi:hypothetical protein
MPNIGRPFGPCIWIWPIWFLLFLQAIPPFGIVHFRNEMENSASRITKRRLLSGMVGIVNINQIVSNEDEGKPII